MLNGVSVARRKRVNPAAGDYFADARLAGLRSQAQSHFLRSRAGRTQQRRQGVVDPSYRIQIVFQFIVGEGLNNHPGSIFAERLQNVVRGADRVAHVVQAVEDGDEIVVFAREILGFGDLKLHAVGDAFTLGAFAGRLNRLIVIIEPDESATWETP